MKLEEYIKEELNILGSEQDLAIEPRVKALDREGLGDDGKGVLVVALSIRL